MPSGFELGPEQYHRDASVLSDCAGVSQALHYVFSNDLPFVAKSFLKYGNGFPVITGCEFQSRYGFRCGSL